MVLQSHPCRHCFLESHLDGQGWTQAVTQAVLAPKTSGGEVGAQNCPLSTPLYDDTAGSRGRARPTSGHSNTPRSTENVITSDTQALEAPAEHPDFFVDCDFTLRGLCLLFLMSHWCTGGRIHAGSTSHPRIPPPPQRSGSHCSPGGLSPAAKTSGHVHTCCLPSCLHS